MGALSARLGGGDGEVACPFSRYFFPGFYTRAAGTRRGATGAACKGTEVPAEMIYVVSTAVAVPVC